MTLNCCDDDAAPKLAFVIALEMHRRHRCENDLWAIPHANLEGGGGGYTDVARFSISNVNMKNMAGTTGA